MYPPIEIKRIVKTEIKKGITPLNLFLAILNFSTALDTYPRL